MLTVPSVPKTEWARTIVELHDPHEQQKQRRERLKFRLEIATAVVIFAYTTVTIFQWRAVLASNR